MRHRILRLSMWAVTTATIVLFLSSMLITSEAFSFDRVISRTSPKGLTSTRSTNTSRISNGYTRNSVYTGPNGNTTTRSAAGQWDNTTKTWNRNGTTTSPNGQSITSNSSASRTTNGYSRNTTMTGPQGNTGSRNVTGTWDPVTKTWTKTASGSR
jgi:hypothetical protein